MTKEEKLIIDQCMADLSQWKVQDHPAPYRPVEEYFHCKVKDIDTQMCIFLNGWYVHDNMPLTISPEGVIVGSLTEAAQRFPDKVLPYLNQKSLPKEDDLSVLNRQRYNDGLFVYVPENVTVEKPIQLISLTDSPD